MMIICINVRGIMIIEMVQDEFLALIFRLNKMEVDLETSIKVIDVQINYNTWIYFDDNVFMWSCLLNPDMDFQMLSWSLQ